MNMLRYLNVNSLQLPATLSGGFSFNFNEYERKFNMKNFDLEQNISDANASGREHSFAPQIS